MPSQICRGAVGPAFLLFMLLCLPASAQQWRGSVGLTTDYVLRGVSQSDGDAAVQAGASYHRDAGWYAGVWASTLQLERAQPYADPARVELDLFVGFGRPIGPDWTVDVGLIRYMYPEDPRPIGYDYTELSLTLGYRDRLQLNIAASPDTSGYSTQGAAQKRWAVNYGLSARQPLPYELALSGGLGYYDLRQLFDTGYWYWSAGIALELRRVSFDLLHVETDTRGQDLYGELAEPRTVFSVTTVF